MDDLERGVSLILDYYLIYSKEDGRLFCHQKQFESLEARLIEILNEAYDRGRLAGRGE